MATIASACGKAILVGEHAVVYCQPAIAVPVRDVRAEVAIEPMALGEGVRVIAHDLDLSFSLDKGSLPPAAEPLATTLSNTLKHLDVDGADLACRVHIRSQVPVARGMGSGTAVATALVRGLARYLGREIDAAAVSDLVFQTEIQLHGTPSGIDNTVVAHERPVYYVKGRSPETFVVGAPMVLVIGDTGVRSETKNTVAMVRHQRDLESERFQGIFVEIGGIATQARCALEQGHVAEMGVLMNRNQELLRSMGVSSPELENLVAAARSAGALGAKLSGGGVGGCMIALCGQGQEQCVVSALTRAGAAAVFTTTVS